jgi:hypothetical protein
MSKQTEAMKLDKDDIKTAKGVALTLQKCQTPELVVVGNLLAKLLAEREATLAREWVGLTDGEVMVAAYRAGFEIHEDYENEDDPEAMHWWTYDGEVCDDSLLKLRDLIEAKLKEKNT